MIITIDDLDTDEREQLINELETFESTMTEMNLGSVDSNGNEIEDDLDENGSEISDSDEEDIEFDDDLDDDLIDDEKLGSYLTAA